MAERIKRKKICRCKGCGNFPTGRSARFWKKYWRRWIKRTEKKSWYD